MRTLTPAYLRGLFRSITRPSASIPKPACSMTPPSKITESVLCEFKEGEITGLTLPILTCGWIISTLGNWSTGVIFKGLEEFMLGGNQGRQSRILSFNRLRPMQFRRIPQSYAVAGKPPTGWNLKGLQILERNFLSQIQDASVDSNRLLSRLVSSPTPTLNPASLRSLLGLRSPLRQRVLPNPNSPV